MKLYLISIIIWMLIIFGFDCWFAMPMLSLTIWQAALGVFAYAVAVLLIDIFVVLIVFFVLPKKWFNPFSKLFKTRKSERRFYEKLGVRKWKDKIPAGIGFRKDKMLDIKNNDYVFLFLRDNCMAEIDHVTSLFLGFLILLILPKYIWCFSFPVACVNAILNTLPVIVQRYNRPKLYDLYRRNEKYNSHQNEIDK